MGDFATRKSDGKIVKIGVLGDMYYCRWEQVKDLEDIDYSIEDCFWRIPLPSEDGTQPGDYEYDGLLKGGVVPYDLRLATDNFDDGLRDDFLSSDSDMVMRNEASGMELVVPCYHDLKTPCVGDTGMVFRYRPKKDVLHLAFLKNTEKELRVGVKCAACGNLWSFTFREIEPYIVSMDMKLRLFEQCVEYWRERNKGICPYSITFISEVEKIEIYDLYGEGEWLIERNGKTFLKDTFDECLITFKSIVDNLRRKTRV